MACAIPSLAPFTARDAAHTTAMTAAEIFRLLDQVAAGLEREAQMSDEEREAKREEIIAPVRKYAIDLSAKYMPMRVAGSWRDRGAGRRRRRRIDAPPARARVPGRSGAAAVAANHARGGPAASEDPAGRRRRARRPDRPRRYRGSIWASGSRFFGSGLSVPTPWR